ncbi:MAG: sel1 repeat family protein [Paludibacteraceae bacterium]|nr:sel1 repeat family protein [Paludibacteraceae bacterium]
MKLLNTISGFEDFFILKNGEEVFIDDDNVIVNNQTFPKTKLVNYVCENGVLLKEDGSNLSIYNKGRFHRLKIPKYRFYHFRKIYGPDVFCAAQYEMDGTCNVLLHNHRTEYRFKTDYKAMLTNLYFNTKYQVLVLMYSDRHLAYSEKGEKLWELKRPDNSQIEYATTYIEDDSDIHVVRIGIENRKFIVCHNLLTGEVKWRREDTYSLGLFGSKCEDGIYRGLLAYGDNCALLAETNPTNGETAFFTLKEGAEAVKYEGAIEKSSVHSYHYTQQGDKIYFIKEYNNELIRDYRVRTWGFVDIKEMKIYENALPKGFCYSYNGPYVNGNNLYVSLQHVNFNHFGGRKPGKTELLIYDLNSENTTHENKQTHKEPRSGDYKILLYGDKLFYVYLNNAIVVDLKKKIICQRIILEGIKISPLTAVMVDGKLLAKKWNTNEWTEFTIEDSINEELDDQVDVELIEDIARCSGINKDLFYNVLFYQDKFYLLYEYELAIVDIKTGELLERIAPEGLTMATSAIQNENELWIYVISKTTGKYEFRCFNLNQEKPFVSIIRQYALDQWQAGNYEKAVEWYAKEAEQGDAYAQYKLGSCLCEGKGVTQNYEKAAEWFTIAAVQGNPDAQFELARCYDNGNGVQKNHTKAIEWYSKAAEQGHVEAMSEINREKLEMIEKLTQQAINGDDSAKQQLFERDWHVGDEAFVELFGVLTPLEIRRAHNEYENAEDKEIRNGKLTPREIELLMWLILEFDFEDIEDKIEEVVDYNEDEDFCFEFDELGIERIYLKTEASAKDSTCPDISISGKCGYDTEHGIAICFRDKKLLEIGAEEIAF